MSGRSGERGPRRPAHQVTTRNLGAAYPLVAEGGLGHRGVLVGQDLLGGSFVFDPFELYEQGVLSNPNMIVFGQIGRGKSAFVKTFLWRQSVFGRRAWVVDPKGEYGELARRWGVTPLTLRPGGPVRLNPLDPGPGDPASSIGSGGESGDRRRCELLGSLAATCLGRPLRPRERVAIDLALVTLERRVPVPTLPDVVDVLLRPDIDAARSIRTDTATLLEDGRDVALELRRTVHGDLRGMFDGPTTPGVDLSGPLVVLDLSALYGSAALGILMTCATAWLQSALRNQRVVDSSGWASRSAAAPVLPSTGSASTQSSSTESAAIEWSSTQLAGQVVLVVDEAWAILANVEIARWLQASWKMSRAYGVANVAVLHRLSDLQSVGARDSEQVGLAEGLLSDSETRVIYAQSPGEVARSTELFSLSSTEAELLPQLQRGVALWKVGGRSFLVQHVVGRHERPLVDTDVAMGHVGRLRQ